MATYRIPRGLQDIPSERFQLRGETVGYERGMSHFREPSEFSEEGILELIGEEYIYRPVRRVLAPHMQTHSRLSPPEHVELQDNSPPLPLPPSRNQYDVDDLVQWQLPLTTAQSTSSQIHDQPSGDDSPFNFNHRHPEAFHGSPHYVYVTMDEIEQTYPRAMSTTPSSTSAPHSMQWDSSGTVSPYGQVQYSLGYGESMSSPQQDVQMEYFGLVPTPPYGTNNAGGDH